MLESFKGDISNLDKLVENIKNMLIETSCALEDIKETIRDHILEEKSCGFDLEKCDSEVISEAECISINAIDDLIDDLEVNEMNFCRLKDYIKNYYSYNAYNRLIIDFDKFIDKNERQILIKKGKEIFCRDITKYWD